MSTTRHLLNRQRRLAAQQGAGDETSAAAAKAATGTGGTGEGGTGTGSTGTGSTGDGGAGPGARSATAVRERGPAARTATRPGPEKSATTTAGSTTTVGSTTSAGSTTAARSAKLAKVTRTAKEPRPAESSGSAAEARTAREGVAAGSEDTTGRTALRAVPRRLLAVCAVVTLAFGVFAAWGASEAGALRDGAAARNTALSDAGRTSEVKGEVTSAVNALFSYDHASPAKNTRAAKKLLTGRAIAQHRALLAQVRAQGSEQRIVLTTTVTDSAVAALEGDRARVLLFADQHSARTGTSAQKKGKSTKSGKSVKSGKKDDATYAGAMLSVDAVREAGAWKIANIDTLN